MARQKSDEKNFLYTEDNWLFYKQYVQNLRLPYIIESSNYCTRFRCGNINLNFMTTQQPNCVFAAYNMIKKNIKDKNIEPPKINLEDLAYFNFSIPDKILNTRYHEIWNVDIKSAYSTVLTQEKIIEPDTVKMLSRIPKTSRLVSVGMLASKKLYRVYDENNKLTNFYTEIAPTANFFFLCVKKTGDYIQLAEQEIKQDFIFSWVDGIYCFSESGAKKVEKVLFSLGLKYKTRKYFDFIVKKNASNSKTVTFCETPNGTKKTFLLPEMNTIYNAEIVKMLGLNY